jgi:hypothetical protein
MTDKNPPGKDELRKRLSSEQYRVTQEAATEAPFTGIYVDCKDDGIYRCVCCGSELFSSEHKYDSGCPWQGRGSRLGKIERWAWSDRRFCALVAVLIWATFFPTGPDRQV